MELSDWAGEQQQREACYRFQLEGEEKEFALHLEQTSSSGAQENIMTTAESGLPFSTADRDNDLAADVNCAELLSGKKPQHIQTAWSGLIPRIIRTKHKCCYKNALLVLQVVGGSVVAASQTSMADIPEGRARSDGSGPEDKRCSGRPQRDKATL